MPKITSYFESAEDTPMLAPTTAPRISIRREDTQALVVTAQSMTEIGDGLYRYDFAETATLEYTFICDGDPLVAGQTLAGGRYTNGSFSGITEARLETDIPAILVDTDTTIPALIPSALDNADAVWDEILTGGTHNINNSAGKRVRQQAEAVVAMEGQVVDAGATTLQFDTDLTEVDTFWEDTILIFIDGALTGQARTIAAYLQTNGSVTVDEPWTSAPANGTSFLLLATHVHPIVEIVDNVWDEARAGHAIAGTYGEFTGDATMRGTDSANTVVPLAAATDQAEHDATQAQITALNDPTAAAVATATWDALRSAHVTAGTTGNAMSLMLNNTSSRSLIDTSTSPWQEVHYTFDEATGTDSVVFERFDLYDQDGAAITGDATSGSNPLFVNTVIIAERRRV